MPRKTWEVIHQNLNPCLHLIHKIIHDIDENASMKMLLKLQKYVTSQEIYKYT